MTRATAEQMDGPVSADVLKHRQFAPLKFIVDSLIPTGLTILAGAPKARKSWLAVDIALSVARGVACLDERKNLCPEGAVLYLALEDSERRLKDRLGQMLGDGPAWPANLYFETSWPRMDADGVPRLLDWIEATPGARLIVIDVFQKFRSATGAQAGYAKDYADLTELQDLAREKNIGIILVHHLRKSGGGDPFERMTGSTGILGAADTLLVLDKGRGGTRLLAEGKDIEPAALDISFDDQAKRWRMVKPGAAVSSHPERDRIVAVLTASPQPLAPREIAEVTGQGADAVRQLLKTMADVGEIEKTGRGRYVARRAPAAWPSPGDHSNHNDHNDHDAYNEYLALRGHHEAMAANAPEGDVSKGAVADLNSVHDALDETVSRLHDARLRSVGR